MQGYNTEENPFEEDTNNVTTRNSEYDFRNFRRSTSRDSLDSLDTSSSLQNGITGTSMSPVKTTFQNNPVFRQPSPMLDKAYLSPNQISSNQNYACFSSPQTYSSYNDYYNTETIIGESHSQHPTISSSSMLFPDQELPNSESLHNFEKLDNGVDIYNFQKFTSEFHPNVSTGQVLNSEIMNVGSKEIEIIEDYCSFDYPVPDALLQKVPFENMKNLNEFKAIRYHAITVEPNQYKSVKECESNEKFKKQREFIEHYPLRPNLYKQIETSNSLNTSHAARRQTELLIVVTMYNEDDKELARTLKGIFENIKTMMKLEEDSTVHPFGKDAWQKIVVAVVADGRTKINTRSKALLTALGCFQEDLMQIKVNNQDVKSHLFEYTTTFGIGTYDSSGIRKTVPLTADNTVPVQMMFLLKEENKQKINSHRWAFNFLCPILKPNVVCLLDVGTEPGYDSIYKLWSAFKNPQVAGACGEIRALLGRDYHPESDDTKVSRVVKFLKQVQSDAFHAIKNPLVAAQNFEYKMSNILDKPTESALGFISVLPGAFSAYRYSALEGVPLQKYFHGEDMKDPSNESPAGVFESNMYLAEDRILCYELVAKQGSDYILKYVHDSYAYTDVPSELTEFMKQRRRWLNGSFFASVYSIYHGFRILRSGHTASRNLVLGFEMLYQLFNVALSWLSVSFYFIVFRVLSIGVYNAGVDAGNVLGIIFLWYYIFLLAMCFILSFGNRPDQAKFIYKSVFYLYGGIMIYMAYCVITITVVYFKDNGDDLVNNLGSLSNIIIALISTYALYIFGSALFGQFFHLFFCFIQYYLLSPAYVNFLNVYAFCNIHDISWGTKGETKIQKTNSVTLDKESHLMKLSESLANPSDTFDEACKLLMKENKVEKPKPSSSEISAANFTRGRTYTVLLWLLSNFAVLVSVLETGGLDDYKDLRDDATTAIAKRTINQERSGEFMIVILWIVAALALIRLVGAITYRIQHAIDSRKYHNSYVYRS